MTRLEWEFGLPSSAKVRLWLRIILPSLIVGSIFLNVASGRVYRPAGRA